MKRRRPTERKDPDPHSPLPWLAVEGGRRIGKRQLRVMTAKQALQEAFDRLGGIETLVEWAALSPENYGDFLKLYARLIPLQVEDRGSSDEARIAALMEAKRLADERMLVVQGKLTMEALPKVTVDTGGD